MNFADLHELLRLELLRRIEAGSLSGNKLAQLTGFRQAHISNFLNQRRSLSLEGLNRVLDSQSLKIEDLLPLQIAASTGTAANQPLTHFQEAHVEPIEPIPVVTVAVALANPKVHLTPTTECLHITTSLPKPSPPKHGLEYANYLAANTTSPKKHRPGEMA